MLIFQWNALRVGDRVLVHDDLAADLGLREGVVRLVEVREGAANDLGIQLGSRGPITRPRRHAVHLIPIDPSSCWRCGAVAAASELGRKAA